MLTSSSGTNYVPNEHEDVDQYGSFTIPSEIMPCESYPVSLVNQNGIPVDLSCQDAHLALFMSLASIKMLTNMALWDAIWDNAISKPSWKFREPKWNPYWVIMLTSSSGTNYVPNEHEDVDQYDSYTIPSKQCHVKAILKVWWIKLKSLLSYRVNKLIWH